MSASTAHGPSQTWPNHLQRIYDCADSLDAHGFASYFTPTGTMRFGNSEPVTGPQDIETSLRNFFAAIATMSHRLVNMWEAPNHAIFEAIVTYGRLDGADVQVPAVTSYVFDGDLVTACQMYCDMSPVFENASLPHE